MRLNKSRNKQSRVFDMIAPIYDLFYDYQKRRYNSALDSIFGEWILPVHKTIVDLGCGTGALCSVLNQRGLEITGVDLSQKMINLAKSKKENASITFLQANVLQGLPFEDNTFDIAMASFVAHGLSVAERKALYMEMRRIARHLAVVYDYNGKRSVPVNIIEWLEGGDYFNFIKSVKQEMEQCFSYVYTINVGPQSAWYICEPGYDGEIKKRNK